MNWGTKLIIAMGLFMAFIITLSVKMIFSSDDALIDKNYYEKSLNYDKDYNSKQSAMADSVLPFIEVNEYGLNISFTAPASCKLNFKRLANAKMDTIIERNTDEDFSIQIQEGDLASGPWLLSLSYVIENKNYLVEQEVIMP